MLIASKLLCASEQEYIYESIKTEISCHGELFTASGKNVLQYGWKEVEERFFKSYGKNAEKPEEEESDFPDIKIGQVFECVVVKFSEHLQHRRNIIRRIRSLVPWNTLEVRIR